jgi:hypothetical protein
VRFCMLKQCWLLTGGDIRALADNARSENWAYHERFFGTEFRLNQL